MQVEARDHGTLNIDAFSGSGLCVLCDNAVEVYDIGLCERDGHAYLAHASCIRQAWEDREQEEENGG